MSARVAASLVVTIGTLCAAAALAAGPDLAGTWAGALTHDGERQPVALSFTPDTSGRLTIAMSIPIIHLDRAMLGRVAPRVEGDSVHLGPFHFRWDAAQGTLSGTVPAGLIPVYEIPIELRKVERFEAPPRPPLAGREAKPKWTHDAGAPIWAGPTFAGGVVYAGDQQGWVVALDARTGAKRWSFEAGGPIRTRPVVAGAGLYFQADDGHLYKLASGSGALEWRVPLVAKPIERLPFDDPKSRFDRFGSDVTLAAGRLYVGTHDGQVLALDPADGRTIWSFEAGDAVLAAPAVADGRVLFGSYDHHVYALDAATGRQLWKHDARAAVVSTPAVAGGRAIVGTRGYDLLGLDAATGAVAWKRYVWMSWVESSAAVRDRVAYVGSSDAAALYALDAESGAPLWKTDVHGWAWGQPAVTARRVYTGTSSQVGYLSRHEAGVVALDRATGAVVWRFAAAAPDSGAFGFPGSPAVGAGKVFVGGLDGRVYAFAE